MAILVFSSSLSSTHQRFPSFRSSSLPCTNNNPPCVVLPLGRRRKTRGLSLVTRAAPSANTYIFAFLLPLSLLAITVFTSISIDMKLDRLFMEEMAVNEAIAEVGGDDDDDDEKEDGSTSSSPKEKPVRMRNRPKKEVET